MTSEGKPKILTDEESCRRARYIRDRQWRFMECIAEHRVLWFCIWNKKGLPQALDEWRDGLITGMEIQDWIDRHRKWFLVGPWNDERYARRVQLTKEGNQALAVREKYDMEPVFGGMVEPGWMAIPSLKVETQ